MITASSLTRLRNCPSSAVMPRAENHNVWADAGSEDHEELAIQVDTGTLPENLAGLVPPKARPELAVAYDVALRVGRVIGENLGRAYGSPGPFEIVGSCDVGGVDGDAVVVLDWKCGYADVEPAATNGQLWFYALALCRAFGKDRAIIRIVYTKTGRVDEYEIDALELAEFAGSLERLHTQVAERQAAKNRGEVLETREGSWCKHCPARALCPAKNALLVQLATGGLAVIGDSTMTPERAAAAYEQVVRIEQLVKDARARLTTYVDDQGPIDLGGGRMFGRYVRGGNERLDGSVAIKAIREVVGESAREFEAIAIEHSTSKAAITRAAKALADKRGATKLATAVVARVRELGGASHGAESMPVGEFVRGKDEPAEKPAIDIAQVNALLESHG